MRKYLDAARVELAIQPDEGTLFLGYLGEPIRPDPLTAIVRGYVAKAGIGRVGSCHLFRHTAAVMMLEHGADIRFIQQLLGHADLKNTEVYTRVSIEQLTRMHQLTHPGASLKFEPPPRVEGLRVSMAQVTDKDSLLAAVDAEDDEAEDAQ